MELNPNHPVTRAASQQWHKIAALIMVKLDIKEIRFTAGDVARIQSNVNIVLDERGSSETGTFAVRIVDDRTAAELARKEGGRAIDS